MLNCLSISPVEWSLYGGLSTLDETGKNSLVLKIGWSSKAMGAGMNCD